MIRASVNEVTASPQINQYERGKHTPEFSTSERFVRVLEVPTPYLYCRDDELGDRVLAYKKLSKGPRQEVLRRAYPRR